MKKVLLSLVALLAMSVSAWSQDGLSIADAEVMPGQSTVIQLYLENTSGTAYRDFGFTFNLPDGLTRDTSKDGITPGENLQDAANIMPGGQTLVMCVPDQDAVDAGDVDIEDYYITTSGVLLNIRLIASADLEVGTVLNGSLVSFELSDKDGAAAIRTEVPFKVKVVDCLTLDENSTVAPTLVADDVKVIVKRTIKGGKWNTICLPFAMDEDQIQEAFGDVELAEFDYYDLEKDGDDIVGMRLYFDTATEIAANTPYLIRTENDITEFSLTADLETDEEEAVATSAKGDGTAKKDGKFIGLYHKDVVPANGLFIRDNNFYYSTGESIIKGYRGYFTLKHELTERVQASSVKILIDNATAVNSINAVDTNGAIFSIDGKKMGNDTSRLQKGVYIIDGKKVAIK